MSNPVQVIDLDKQYGESIHAYIKNVLLVSANPTDAEIENAYSNIRLWLDSINIKQDGVAYIDSHKEEALKVATGPAYEDILAQKEAAKAPVINTANAKVKIAAIAALIALAAWYLFKDSSEGAEVI